MIVRLFSSMAWPYAIRYSEPFVVRYIAHLLGEVAPAVDDHVMTDETYLSFEILDNCSIEESVL